MAKMHGYILFVCRETLISFLINAAAHLCPIVFERQVIRYLNTIITIDSADRGGNI